MGDRRPLDREARRHRPTVLAPPPALGIPHEVLAVDERGPAEIHRRRNTKSRRVGGVLIGSQALFDWARENPRLQLVSSDITHGGATLAKIERFVAINSAVEVDLTGQVNGEVARGSYVGAVGGALDFVRAANQSAGGLSIIALPAARIVERLAGPDTAPQVSSTEELMRLARGAADGSPTADRPIGIIAAAARATDMTVADIMVPRTEVVAYSVDTPPGELLKSVLEEGYTRVPIFEGSIDRVLGVAHLKDLVEM